MPAELDLNHYLPHFSQLPFSFPVSCSSLSLIAPLSSSPPDAFCRSKYCCWLWEFAWGRGLKGNLPIMVFFNVDGKVIQVGRASLFGPGKDSFETLWQHILNRLFDYSKWCACIVIGTPVVVFDGFGTSAYLYIFHVIVEKPLTLQRLRMSDVYRLTSSQWNLKVSEDHFNLSLSHTLFTHDVKRGCPYWCGQRQPGPAHWRKSLSVIHYFSSASIYGGSCLTRLPTSSILYVMLTQPVQRSGRFSHAWIPIQARLYLYLSHVPLTKPLDPFHFSTWTVKDS